MSWIVKPLSTKMRFPGLNTSNTPQEDVIALSLVFPGCASLTYVMVPFGATPIKNFAV